MIDIWKFLWLKLCVFKKEYVNSWLKIDLEYQICLLFRGSYVNKQTNINSCCLDWYFGKNLLPFDSALCSSTTEDILFTMNVINIVQFYLGLETEVFWDDRQEYVAHPTYVWVCKLTVIFLGLSQVK